MSDPSTEILDKIKKILALADRAGTEAEAQAAMTRVYVMLAKYNLSMNEVEAHNSERIEQVTTDASVPSPMRNTMWRDTIYDGVSSLYFCQSFNQHRKGQRYYFLIGKPSNIAVVHNIARYLIETGENLALKDAQTIRLNRRAWINSYRIGFAVRIYQRCQEELQKAMQGQTKDETGTALTIAPLYNQASQEIDLYKEQESLRIKEGKSKAPNVANAGGFIAGAYAAENTSLNRQNIGQQKARRLA